MASQTLPTGHLEAGTEYLSALRGLGLDPEGLLWAHDRIIQDFVLVLVTAQFDSVGPLELYRVLTHAHNASATPQAVSPFAVQLHSPVQSVARELFEAYGCGLHADPDLPGPLLIMTQAELNVGALTFRPEWVYQLLARTVPPAERARRWRRFKGNVDALAA